MFAEMSKQSDRWSQRFGRFVRRLPRGLGKDQGNPPDRARSDDLTHSILTKLNQTFITPFDREEHSQSLPRRLDDVSRLDQLRRRQDHHVQDPPSRLPPQPNWLDHPPAESKNLRRRYLFYKKNGDVLLHCVEINRLENEADQVSRGAIGELFEHENDPINLIKIKELIEVLETATDKAEDAADVLETVALKNA